MNLTLLTIFLIFSLIFFIGLPIFCICFFNNNNKTYKNFIEIV